MILTLIRIKNTNHQFFVSTYLKPLDGMNKLFNPIIYTKQSDDEDIASIFISKLTTLTNKIYNDYYKRPKQLKLTTQEQEEFDKVEICHICSKEFYEEHRTCKILKSETIVTLLESIVVQHTTLVTCSVENH